MGVHGSNDVVNAWKQEVLNSRGKDAEHTLKCCLDIERYAKEHKDAALLGFAYFYSGETYYLLNDVEHMFRNIAQAIHLQCGAHVPQHCAGNPSARTDRTVGADRKVLQPDGNLFCQQGKCVCSDGLLSDRIELLPQIWDY